MTMWLVASVVLSLLAAYYVFLPLFDPLLEDSPENVTSASHLALLDSKERALRALKDLELDYAMGKVSAEDFEATKQSLAREAATILSELSKHDGQ